MLKYIIKRLLFFVVTLVIVSIIVFSIIHFVPGDPVLQIVGKFGDPAAMEHVRKTLNLDKPIATQYFIWISNALKGDLGRSFKTGQPITDMIFERYPKTFILVTASMIISVIVSVISGVIAASRRNTGIDFSIMTFTVIGLSIPQFWMGVLFILVFSLFLKLLPVIGYVSLIKDPIDAIKHLILPAVALSITQTSIVARMTRSEMLEVLGQDYIKTARAKGLKENVVIFKHALKNALIPIVTLIGIQFGFLMGGTIVIEQIFTYPGLGSLLIDAVFNRDYPLIQGIVIFVSLIFIIINLVVDLLYAYLNPKVTLE
jgi:peptide/nickel transport system permease protein